MTLEDIPANKEMRMTKVLVAAFKYGGCSPTICHACKKKIKVGDAFKLIPHKEFTTSPSIDEMVCGNCDDESLTRRDKRDRATRNRAARIGGYSRPHKGAV